MANHAEQNSDDNNARKKPVAGRRFLPLIPLPGFLTLAVRGKQPPAARREEEKPPSALHCVDAAGYDGHVGAAASDMT